MLKVSGRCIMVFNKKKINTEEINAMTIGADIISVNNRFGHYEIGEQVGVTKELELEKYIIKIVGGIIVDVKEKGINNE